MHRRDFLALSGLGLGNTVLGCCVGPRISQSQHSSLVAQMIAQNDASIPDLLERQQLDPSHRWFGGIVNSYGLYFAGSGSAFLRDLAIAYLSPESRYHSSAALAERMAMAAKYMLAAQHNDGTIDLLTTNFHSTPDTGFILEWMCATAGLLKRAQHQPELSAVIRDLDAFIERGALGLVTGGIHTPNHRWVVCMALARANSLHPDPLYVARADEWLSENIDIDPDGQFTERSSSIYSPLTDRCLITVARLLDRPALLEPVRRNLEMTMYYVHADGEVATEGSKRQDQYRRGSLSQYYYPYRYMALHDNDGRFAAMARWIEHTAAGRLGSNLAYFLEDESLQRELPASAELPTSYQRHFAHSDLVRIRRSDVSTTILADNPTCLSFHKGSAAIVVRFASAFFGKGQFVGTALRKQGSSWVMHQDLTGPYYQPMPEQHRSPDGNWHAMPRDLRPQSEVQQLHSELRIREADGGLVLEFDIRGTADVPVAIELGFRPGGQLEGVTPIAGSESAFLLASDEGRFRFGDDVITFGPGRADHQWTQLRGALPKLASDCVYLTANTPLRATLRLH